MGISSSDLLKTKKGRGRGRMSEGHDCEQGQFPCPKYPLSYARPVHILRLSQVHTERKEAILISVLNMDRCLACYSASSQR